MFTARCSAFACVVGASAPIALAQQAAFIPLPALGPNRVSYALGVSPDGRFAAGGSASSAGIQAVVWDLDAEVVRPLGFLAPGSNYSEATGVSDGGAVVVGQSLNPTQIEAFRVVGGGSMEPLGSLGPTSDYIKSSALDVSADGAQVVGFARSPLSAFGTEAFHFGASMIGLGDLLGGAFNSVARAITPDGSVTVGEASDGTGNRAVRWTQSTGIVALPDLPGGAVGASAQDVSADGNVVVGRSIGAGGAFAVAWRNGQVQSLGALLTSPADSQAFGVSGDGGVIVGTSLGSLSDEAFIWTQASGLRSLKLVLETEFGISLTGWSLLVAHDVSTDGSVIVGEGINPQGVVQAWMVRFDSACAADFNSDGQADFFDYLDFVVAFDAEAPEADVNDDAQVDFFDYLDFVASFDAGCD
ncbi:MAG: PEP-CTERM sorting domain-containing protein [Planctomycetota bacterium]|nr:PEP-CTERM sorting domain-containing protein [Planctomycetota bacterium]